MSMYGKSRIIFVILILLGTAIMPATISSSIEQNATIKITTYEGAVIEKQLPIENINELLSLLNILKGNPSEYRVYLPVILKKLEEFGLIEDATRTEKAILENIKECQLNGPGNIFMNAFCFVIGKGTNSVILPLSTLLVIGYLRLVLRIVQYFPFLFNVSLMASYFILGSLFYVPRLYFPFGIWDIGWDGEISTFGLFGYKDTTINGGKWGKSYLIFGFRGIWLTLPMEEGYGYPKNWFLGTSLAIVGR